MSGKDGKPKRGLSAYMFFCNDKRTEINKDFPDMKFVEISKKLGEMWKSLTPESKAPYEAKAKEDKQRYLDEMAKIKEPSKKKSTSKLSKKTGSDSDKD